MTRIIIVFAMCLLMFRCLGEDDGARSWKYKFETYSPDKRNEYVCGHLFYQGRELPKEFGHVVTPIGEFVFIDNRGPASEEKLSWLPFGRYPDGEMMAAANRHYAEQLLNEKDPSFRTTATKEIPTEVSKKAFLAGSFDERPVGTGTDWFYLVKQGLWVNPMKIKFVLKSKLEK